ncbi:phosphorylase [Leptospira sp. WS39.C2]
MPALFFAILSEAKPWIQKTNAKPISHSGKFRIYQKDSMYITITGPGKIPMALAVSEFAHLFGKEERKKMKVWNLGIAGSHIPNTKIGEYFWIHKIKDYNTGKDYYPERILSSKIQKETILTTFDNPIAKIKNENRFQVLTEQELQSISLVDMEGSAFFEAASLYFPLENIAIGKVISDFLEATFCQQETVQTLIENVLDPLYQEWIEPLPWSTDDLFETKFWPELETKISNLRLTETMKHDLKKSLRFFYLRYPNSNIPLPNLETIPNIKSKQDLKLYIQNWKNQLHV